MQHPWLLPFLHPLTTGAGAPNIQLTLPPPVGHHHHPHQVHPHHHHHHVHHPHHQMASNAMAGLSLQPMLAAPSGALLLPALQQNAAAAVAAFAAAAAAAAAAASQHQQQQAPGTTSAVFTMAGSPVIMSPFQPRTRLKVASGVY